DDAIRFDAFQRASVELARKAGDAIAGRVGEHGVVFLSAASGSAERKQQKLVDLAERARALARQSYGLSLHFGASSATRGGAAVLSRDYHAALAAAESALTQGVRLVLSEPGAKQPRASLRHLRQELGAAAEEHPGDLAARFDRFLEAVAIHCGYRVEPARAHLETGFERMAERLTGSGALDRRSFEALNDALDRAAGAARTMNELFAAYRSAVSDVSAAVLQPVPARQDRGLRGAVEYIRQHYTEPLSVKQVAKVAGFNPTYFSLLFKRRERVTFEKYVHALRLARAKNLLTRTELSITRVAELSGHGSLPYFCRIFRRAVGKTPLAYRNDPGTHENRAKSAKPGPARTRVRVSRKQSKVQSSARAR
ncbi:MAG TPA: AraC family transcriptional regulator, partial [Polyangiaceae bacterium]|nr:AraC family transcriptional regulator [Polyangiaceae bacterium]